MPTVWHSLCHNNFTGSARGPGNTMSKYTLRNDNVFFSNLCVVYDGRNIWRYPKMANLILCSASVRRIWHTNTLMLHFLLIHNNSPNRNTGNRIETVNSSCSLFLEQNSNWPDKMIRKDWRSRMLNIESQPCPTVNFVLPIPSVPCLYQI